jgi:hypothetical protein
LPTEGILLVLKLVGMAASKEIDLIYRRFVVRALPRAGGEGARVEDCSDVWGLIEDGRAATAAFGTQSAFVPSGGFRFPGTAEKGLQEIGVGAEVRMQEMRQGRQRWKESL